MIYAPVLIPTLCRSDHFIRCLESLKKNTWAKYTEVYIAVDYPAKESHWDGYKRIVEYLSCDCTEFANLHVIKRPYNYGGAANMVALRDYVLKKHDRFIRTDDDCEFSVDFLEYMDCCLEKYEDDDNVIGVTGYSYPVDWNISNNYNAFKNNYVFPMWGTGFWRKKFYTVYAMGRSDYFLKLEIAKKTIGMILLLSTMRFGVMVMAYSLLISSITSQIINSWPNKRLLGYGYLEQLRDIFPSIMTALFMGGCVNLVKLFGLSDLLTLLIQVPLGAIIYIGLSSLLHLEAYQYLTSIVQSVVSKK